VSPAQRRRRLGFTLFEVLGVVLVTALLLGATISFYINLSRQATRAADNTREVRRAAAIVDRIATDLEHTLLVQKPAEDADVLSSPWLFVAAGRYSEPGPLRGSDQIKFIRREVPRASAGPASDVAMVAYTLSRSEEGDHFALRRWSSGELPRGLEAEFPRDDDPRSLLFADDIAMFSLRFLDEAGQWHEDWDSTQVADSSQLPAAVEINVALVPRQPADADSDPDAVVEPVPYARLVELPMRPIDLESLLNPKEKEGTDVAQNEGDEDKKQKTLGECVDITKLNNIGGVGGLSDSDLATLQAAVQNSPATSFAPYASLLSGHPAVNPDCF
jgi:hypothetical protein